MSKPTIRKIVDELYELAQKLGKMLKETLAAPNSKTK
jgi:hypothetical protein